MTAQSINGLATAIRGCRHCAEKLEPNPIFQVNENAKLLIIGQAPGRLTHLSGKPWDDPSGVRLRQWLGISEDDFYNSQKVALVPMSFCFPGRGKGGDLPPVKVCAEKWHEDLLVNLKSVKLTLVIGAYAQNVYLDSKGTNLTETVRNFWDHLPSHFPLPHPSPRNRFWLTRNPWFEERVVPQLQEVVLAALR